MHLLRLCMLFRPKFEYIDAQKHSAHCEDIVRTPCEEVRGRNQEFMGHCGSGLGILEKIYQNNPLENKQRMQKLQQSAMEAAPTTAIATVTTTTNTKMQLPKW